MAKIGHVFERLPTGQAYHAALMSPQIVTPTEGRVRGYAQQPFAPPYWCVAPTKDSADANVQTAFIEVRIQVETKPDVVSLPVLENTRLLKEGDELWFHKAKVAGPEVTEKRAASSVKGAPTKKNKQK